jgi:hypothetical protein
LMFKLMIFLSFYSTYCVVILGKENQRLIVNVLK